MSRAAPLPPSERRQAIIDAATPLLLRQGAAATSTRQIAEACGIAEGTIFRVFDSKQDLVNEVITAELAIGPVLARLAALEASEDFETAVAAAIGLLQRRALIARSPLLLQHPPAGPNAGAKPCPRPHPKEVNRRIITALQEFLTPFAGRLSVTPQAAAGALLALSFGSSFPDPPTEPAQVTRLLLHGIAKDTAC